MSKKIDINSIPKETEIFGRTLKTLFENDKLNLRGLYGEARYGSNKIAVTNKINDVEVTKEEVKLTYLHELFHFILMFTGYDDIIRNKSQIDIEQFIELMSSGVYQALKNAKY